MSGGAGYVISRAALKKFVLEGLRNERKCDGRFDFVNEDARFGQCMQTLGIAPSDTRDGKNRSMFLPLPLRDHLMPGDKQAVAQSYLFYPLEQVKAPLPFLLEKSLFI